jgi:hypothetical protein
MEHLENLQRLYEQTLRDVYFPLSSEEREQLKELRAAIRAKAKELAAQLSVEEPHWYARE